MDKIAELILSGDKRKLFYVLDILLWLSLIVVSFEHWIKPLLSYDIDQVNELLKGSLRAEYIELLLWTVIIVVLYFGCKLLLIKILPHSTIVLKYVQKSILKREYNVPFLALIYQGDLARPDYIEQGRVYVRNYVSKKESREKILLNSNFAIDLLLKIVILGLIKIGSISDGFQFLAWVSIILSLLLVLIIERQIIRLRANSLIAQILSKIVAV